MKLVLHIFLLDYDNGNRWEYFSLLWKWEGRKCINVIQIKQKITEVVLKTAFVVFMLWGEIEPGHFFTRLTCIHDWICDPNYVRNFKWLINSITIKRKAKLIVLTN